MQSGGFTETIWHFAGYLHISDALERNPTLYSGDPQRPLPEDPMDPFWAPIRGLAFDEFVSLSAFFTGTPSGEPRPDHPPFVIPGYRAPQVQLSPLPASAKRFEPADDIALPHGVMMRGSGRVITVEYQEGGPANLIGIHQINGIEDQDLVASDGLRNVDGSLVVPKVLSLEAEFAALVSQAQAAGSAALPGLLGALRGNTDDAAEMAAGRGALMSENAGLAVDAGSDQQVPNGRMVDGKASTDELVEPTLLEIAPWRPQEKEPTEFVEASHHGATPTGGVATLTETGLNTQTNAAGIADLNEAVGSMMVGGNYFYSRGIVQVNVLVDNDHVDIAVADALRPAVETHGNEVHNVAEFITHLSTESARGAASASLWKVDVFSGDLYDVKSVVQFNDLDDKDRIMQTESGTYFDLRAGENQQLNLTKIFGVDRYDIIVIKGDYYRADWIRQYNVVLDSDTTKILTSSDGTTVTAGLNQLTNKAEIETYDAEGFKPMVQAHWDLMGLLGIGSPVLTPNAEWNLYGGSGPVKILYVSGDYYDVNVITQVNFQVDADQSIQAGAKADTVQGVATGGNTVINEARIVDAGLLTKSNYLGGDTYEESVLIQTNIITDSDTVEIHDTQTLVPELVAFAGHADLDRFADHVTSLSTSISTSMSSVSAHNDHFMSHIMH